MDADSVQVEQVLMNLAINARDAMPDGGKLIIETANIRLPAKQAGTQSGAISQEFVSLSVSDTGHGMDKDTLDMIFEPFFSTKAPGKGTGLGLSMVHGIVSNHDGRITCSSKPGEGTCFRIYLPALETIQAQKQIASKAACRGGHETILIVDDDETIRHAGRRRLEKAGYTVLTAGAGERALEVYGQKKEKIDLVLLDLIMPGMGGVRCLQRLLQSDPSINVVIISGYAVDDPTMQTIEACTSGYLRKPYTGEQLLEIVRQALDSQLTTFLSTAKG